MKTTWYLIRNKPGSRSRSGQITTTTTPTTKSRAPSDVIRGTAEALVALLAAVELQKKVGRVVLELGVRFGVVDVLGK